IGTCHKSGLFINQHTLINRHTRRGLPSTCQRSLRGSLLGRPDGRAYCFIPLTTKEEKPIRPVSQADKIARRGRPRPCASSSVPTGGVSWPFLNSSQRRAATPGKGTGVGKRQWLLPLSASGTAPGVAVDGQAA